MPFKGTKAPTCHRTPFWECQTYKQLPNSLDRTFGSWPHVQKLQRRLGAAITRGSLVSTTSANVYLLMGQLSDCWVSGPYVSSLTTLSSPPLKIIPLLPITFKSYMEQKLNINWEPRRNIHSQHSNKCLNLNIKSFVYLAKSVSHPGLSIFCRAGEHSLISCGHKT